MPEAVEEIETPELSEEEIQERVERDIELFKEALKELPTG